MEKHKTCCFLGHRTAPLTEDLKQAVKAVVENLIVNEGVQSFLFGSHSNFNYLCHLVVTELKEKYPNVKRVAYTCKSESCTLTSQLEQSKCIYKRFDKSIAQPFVVEQEVEHPTKHVAGKACYVERNLAMVDASDFCVFYFSKHYVPPQQGQRPAKSGTATAHAYATKRGKVVFNLAQN